MSRLHFFVAGATGRTGRAFVAAAVGAGHRVTAFVRSRQKAPDGVSAIEGDVLDAAAVRAAVTGEQIVVSTLGGGVPNGPGTAVSIGTSNLVAAAASAGARRILVVVGAGVLQRDEATLRNQAPDYPPFLREVAKQHAAAYAALRESGLDWTLVCVPNILDGGATGSFASQANYLPDGSGKITTGDIAAFLTREAESPSFPRSRVGLNSTGS
jgi:putative NADH-flavin reductase